VPDRQAARHTTPEIRSTVRTASTPPRPPANRNTAASRKVQMVIPDTGWFVLPINPTMYTETATKKNTASTV
jgi:hypothetical protein